jgi:hypothetical protein
MGYIEYLATLVASVLISGTLAVFFWRRRPASGAVEMAALCGTVMIWTIGYIVEVTASTLSGFRLANDIEYIGFISAPVIWFIFTARYTRYENWLTRHWYLLFIIPIIILILVG